jgi:hypothetical protein
MMLRRFVPLATICGALPLWGCHRQMSNAEAGSLPDSTYLESLAATVRHERALNCSLAYESRRNRELRPGAGIGQPIPVLRAKCRVFAAADSDMALYRLQRASGIQQPDAFAFHMWEHGHGDQWQEVTVGPFMASERCEQLESLVHAAVVPTSICQPWKPGPV